MKRKRIVIAADIHAGHRSGLTHPDYQPTCSSDAPRALRKVGGLTLGLGTYRGRYGKFEVAMWE